jgi:hypothetical protein
VKDKIRLGHLPPHIASLFDGAFSPHLRVLFGNTTPWEVPPENHIKSAWGAVFPKEDKLDFSTPLGGMIRKLVSHVALSTIKSIYVPTAATAIQIVDRLSSWRHNIGNSGLLALQAKVFSTLQGGDITRARSEWCTWALSHTEENHPFYFAGVVEDEDGNIQSQSVRLCIYLFCLS